SPPGVVVDGGVVAVAGVAAAEDHAVRAPLEGPENEHRVQAAGAGNADDLHIGRVLEPVGAGEVGARVGAPVAAESHNGRLKLSVYLHIASTSAMICALEKPLRSMAPEGQATVQAPQPWQTAGLTWDT